MCGLDLVDYGWSGGSEHSGKTTLTLNPLTKKHAFDVILTILQQQCSDMQLDVERHVVRSSCVECCIKLLEFAHTSVCVCVSCFSVSDAHDFFAEFFIGCEESIRRRRVSWARELQRNTSVRKFFVLGALVPTMLFATRWTTVVKKRSTRTNHVQ